MNVTVRSTTDGEHVEYRITGDDESADDGVEHDLEVGGGDPNDPIYYEFAASGAVDYGDRANTRDGDEYRDRLGDHATASGYVGGGADTWRYVGDLTHFEADGDVTLRIDGTAVDPADAVEPTDSDWTVTDRTDAAKQHDVPGPVRDFEQVGGASDWVLEVDGRPTAFGGPDAPVGGEFAYATRAQVKAFVECTVDTLELDLDLENYVRKDELGSYAQTDEVQAAIADAFERADVTITTSGLTLTTPEE